MHPYLRLAITIEGNVEPPLPPGAGDPLTGPRLRRVLGKALVDRFCPQGKPVCDGLAQGPRHPAADLCMLAEFCPYGVLYAQSRTRRPPFALFVPAASSEEGTSPRERMVEMTLFGPGTSIVAWMLKTLQDALASGLGPQRARYRIKRVTRVRRNGAEELAAADLKTLPAVVEPDLLNLHAEHSPPAGPVIVELLSPTRLKQNNRLLKGSEPIPLSVLVGRTFGRFRDLYGETASDVLRKEIRESLLREADEVQLIANDTRWIEIPDYSARHRTELLLGGKVGRLGYGPGAARFVPILHVAEIMHLGKNTASGCGRIRVLIPEETL